MWIQTGVTVRKRLSWVATSVTLTFDLWPWPFAWTLPWSVVITPENFMMIRWWEHSQKGVTDGQTDGRTDRQTENTIHRTAWSQLKIYFHHYLLGLKPRIHSIPVFPFFYNRPIQQIPQCTCSISHNTPFRREMCTFLFWMVHGGLWNKCIMGFVNCVGHFLLGVYCNQQVYRIITISWPWRIGSYHIISLVYHFTPNNDCTPYESSKKGQDRQWDRKTDSADHDNTPQPQGAEGQERFGAPVVCRQL